MAIRLLSQHIYKNTLKEIKKLNYVAFYFLETNIISHIRLIFFYSGIVENSVLSR